MRSQLWFDPQSVGGFSCLYSEAPAVSFLTPVSGHCQPGELEDQGRWGRAGRGRWSPITTTVQPPSQDTGFPQRQSAVASVNGKTARYHEFINGWFSGAGRAHWVSWKASQIRLANGPAIPLGPWGNLEAASGPLPQPCRRTFINLGGGCMGRYPGLQKKTARGKLVYGENVRGRGDPEYVMFSMQPALTPSPPSEGTDYFLLCACPASLYLFDYPWGWLVTWYLKYCPWKK